MPFSQLDSAAVARALSQLAEQSDDHVDACFERREDVELPPEGEGTGLRVCREEGFAIRLLRGERTWLASRDRLDPRAFAEALRQVARVLPAAAYPEPALAPGAFPALEASELLDFPAAVARAVQAHHVGFPLRLAVRRHRRWLQSVSGRLVTDPQSESYYSCVVETAWGRHGGLLSALDGAAAESLAAGVVALFRARFAPPPPAQRCVAVLGPAAVAVLLHEAVAHALEADTLAATGRPEAAVGLAFAAPGVNVLDDPASAPEGVRRTVDDEGSAVSRRWLLRDGIVESPLADLRWTRASAAFSPGAGRRGSRHLPPGPRSYHLELLAGETAEADLLAEAAGGIYLPEASRGHLDPLSGEMVLSFPWARRIGTHETGELLGPCRLRGRVADLLERVTAIGQERRAGGAGWCAKGGQKMPVWAIAPAIRLEGVEVVP